MAGDYTRMTFDPHADFAGVLMQQGRVQLDADWNELVDVLNRRLRAETLDLIGRAAVPRETPDAFRVELVADTFTLGRGRIYVDGLLAENHGAGPIEIDRALVEPRGIAPVAYGEQPYAPDSFNTPPGGGPHLVYLDVWQREVTAVEEPDLAEPALDGIDTATRIQTVWQARVLPNVGENVTCSTPDGEIPGWLDEIRPSGARLTTEVVEPPLATDPCVIAARGGYRGLENRLYRVEIHDGGPAGTATLKWSRDNGSVASYASSLDGNKITVKRLGRDGVMRFRVGDWIEVVDDERELALLAGYMHRITAVDEVTGMLTLDGDVDMEPFTEEDVNVRNVRVRRWDQRDQVLSASGERAGDLDPTSGVVRIQSSEFSLMLEDGVVVRLSLDPAGGQYETGDYWLFHARAAQGTVERLEEAPPRGTHHHYCKLAVIEFPDRVTDCRTLWPAEAAPGGECTASVTPTTHANGSMTIQKAVDEAKDKGGKVCLAAGVYNLGQTSIDLTGARSVELTGAGWRTALVYLGQGPAVRVRDGVGVTVSDLCVLTAPSIEPPDRATEANLATANLAAADRRAAGVGIELRNCVGASVERCVVYQVGSRTRGGPAIGLGGFLVESRLRDNQLVAAIGIGNLPEGPEEAPEEGAGEGGREGEEDHLFTTGLTVTDNSVWCEQRGITLTGLSFHFGDTRIEANLVAGCRESAIACLGRVLAGSQLDVLRNQVRTLGDGIVVGTDSTRVSGNDVTALREPERRPQIDLDVIRRGGLGGLLGSVLARPAVEEFERVATSRARPALPSLETLVAARPLLTMLDSVRDSALRAAIEEGSVTIPPVRGPDNTIEARIPGIGDRPPPEEEPQAEPPPQVAGDGIAIAAGLEKKGAENCQVAGNRVIGIPGHGIALRAAVRSVQIAHNQIQRVRGGAIVTVADRAGGSVSVESNQISEAGFDSNERGEVVAGVFVRGAARAKVTSNTVHGVGTRSNLVSSCTGIQVLASESVRIAGNEVTDVAPPEDFVGQAAGIEVQDCTTRVEVVENLVRRSSGQPRQDSSSWAALRVRSQTQQPDDFERPQPADRPSPVTVFPRPALLENMWAVEVPNLALTSGRFALGDRFFDFGSGRIAQAPRRYDAVAIRGNMLEGYGSSAPVAEVLGTGGVIFSENHCSLFGAGGTAVRIESSGFIASNNQLFVEGDPGGRGGRAVALEATPTNGGPFSVIGNMAYGELIVGESGLPPNHDWRALNVLPLEPPPQEPQPPEPPQ